MYNTGAERSISQKYAVWPRFVLLLSGIRQTKRKTTDNLKGGNGCISFSPYLNTTRNECKTSLFVVRIWAKRKCCRSVYGHKIKRQISKRKRQNPLFQRQKLKWRRGNLLPSFALRKCRQLHTYIIVFQSSEGFKRPSDGVLLHTSIILSHTLVKKRLAP